MLKRMILLFAAALLGLTLFACGGGSDSPEGVTEKAMEVMAAMDVDSLGEYVCDQVKEQAAAGMALAKAMMDAQKMTMKLSDMKYEKTGEEADKATVHVTGTVTIKMAEGEDQTDSIDEDVQVIKVDGKWKVCEGFM